jgi:uncharacterized zinc-type alcohol dehydrogenase-like protein
MGFRAYAAHEQKGPLAPFVYEPGELGPNDVEIRISHCGICHSDVHLVDGDWGASSYPMVPGHEIVGTVAAAGPAVRQLTIGQRVGVGWQCGACLECEWCVSGQENLCAQEEATCVERPGGFAERIRVDGRFAFPIPDALRSEHAAPLLCGGVTVYAPLARFARPSLRVGVIGIGGLGHLALQFARAMGCEVTALSTNPAKRAEALAFGAHRFLAAGDSKALRAAAQSLDFVLSTAFLAQDWKGLLRMLRPNGVLCLVGAPDESLRLDIGGMLGRQLSVTTSAIGGRPAVRETLAFAARHGIKPMVQLRLLAEADAGLDAVRKGQARYRVVLAA